MDALRRRDGVGAREEVTSHFGTAEEMLLAHLAEVAKPAMDVFPLAAGDGRP
jgi:DNA-binding GntR family transcriptional regulator